MLAHTGSPQSGPSSYTCRRVGAMAGHRHRRGSNSNERQKSTRLRGPTFCNMQSHQRTLSAIALDAALLPDTLRTQSMGTDSDELLTIHPVLLSRQYDDGQARSIHLRPPPRTSAMGSVQRDVNVAGPDRLSLQAPERGAIHKVSPRPCTDSARVTFHPK
jgi:hypothetical protein